MTVKYSFNLSSILFICLFSLFDFPEDNINLRCELFCFFLLFCVVSDIDLTLEFDFPTELITNILYCTYDKISSFVVLGPRGKIRLPSE